MSTNPKDAIGITKPQTHLVPPALVLHTAQAMADGARKYGAYNWRLNAVRLTVYIAAAQRHLFALLDGEDQARDSKVHHAGHVAACMGIILDALETGKLIDDRVAIGPAADIIDRQTQKPAAPAKTSTEEIIDILRTAIADSVVADEPIPFKLTDPQPLAVPMNVTPLPEWCFLCDHQPCACDAPAPSKSRPTAAYNFGDVVNDSSVADEKQVLALDVERL